MTFYSQRDSDDRNLRAHGCGAYAALNALVWATGGSWESSDPTGSARYRVKASKVSDADFNRRGLTASELAESMRAVSASSTRMDLPVQRRSGVNVAGDLIPQLINDGSGAMVAVDYGVVQDGGKGVGSFRGGHWVFVHDPTSTSITVRDPLRRQAVTWPISLLATAMERFGSKPWLNGRGEAIVIRKWQTWRQGYAAMKLSRDSARAQRDKAEDMLGRTIDELAALQATGLPEAIARAEAAEAIIAKVREVVA